MKRFFALASILFAFTAYGQAPETAPPIDAPSDALHSDAGLAWSVLTPATGTAVPTLEEFVTLDYTGWKATGEVFDSTAKHPSLRSFPLAKLFSGMQQTVKEMRVGEKRRVWMPANLAPKGAPVVMDIELLDISRPFAAPEDVAAAPADAEKSKSGLAWKTLRPGTGTAHPKRNSWVVVQYTGWTTDGKMFDSSYATGETASFKLDEVIPGWTEGLQTMAAGEKRRFWIPEKLTYRGLKGMPQGMLVFDIELVKFR